MSPLSPSDTQSALRPVGPEGADTPVVTAPAPAQGAPLLHTHTHRFAVVEKVQKICTQV